MDNKQEQEQKQEESRNSIIKVINSPLKFGALALLVTEGILLYLITGISNEGYKHLYIILMIIILIFVIIAVLYANNKEKKEKKLEKDNEALIDKNPNIIPKIGESEFSQKTFKYDVFLTAPMVAIGDSRFKIFNAEIKEIQTLLQKECGFERIYYSGENVNEWGELPQSAVALQKDIEALKNSQYFVLIYPDHRVSSVLFEAGVAYVLGKPSFYFGKIENFPYLMRGVTNHPHVKTYSIDNNEDVIKMIKIDKGELFKI